MNDRLSSVLFALRRGYDNEMPSLDVTIRRSDCDN